MKKVIFLLFALLVGVGISVAFAADVQPPGQEITVAPQYADVISNEMPAPAIMAVSQEVATEVTYLFQKVAIDVDSGSSGGLAYLRLKPGENELQPLNWNYLKYQQYMDKDRTWCTQKAFCNIPAFANNCNYKFPLI